MIGWVLAGLGVLACPVVWALFHVARGMPSPVQRWCECPDGSRKPWVITDVNGYMSWCPTCRGRLS